MAWFNDTRRMTVETTPPTITGLVWLTVIVFTVSAVSFMVYRYWQPAAVAVQNRTFHESQAYNDGMANTLYDLKRQYENADPTGKAVIAATVREQFASYDSNRLPASLRLFLESVQ